MRVVIVGGSVAGLTAGLVLARSGHAVTICERDPQPLPANPERAAAHWRRGGVPQVRQSHGFLGRLRSELLAAAPDLWQQLLAAGAEQIPLFDRRPVALSAAARLPGDAELVFLACRRSTFDWVLRGAAERECDVRLGVRAEQLLIEAGPGGARVAGVATGDGPLSADVVVDASGRTGGLARRETRMVRARASGEPCGIVYASRFYRLRPGAGWGPLNRLWAAGGSYAGYACVAFPHDAGTFSVNLGRLPEDTALAAAHTEVGFTRATALIPSVSEWVDPERSEPLGPPVPMAGIRNTLVEPAPVRGLFLLGDAACTTDPAFGRGVVLAVAGALALARVLRDTGSDLDAARASFNGWFADEVAPWHADSVQQDRARTAMWRADLDGAPVTLPPALLPAAALGGVDLVLWRAFVRYAMMLASPAELAGPDVVDRLAAVRSSGWLSPASPAPSRQELAAAAAA